ncbi:MAG TPA: Gp37 family protein [Trichocoleus sp.]
MLAELETAIIERLDSVLRPLDVPVFPFPANPEEWAAPVYQTQVLVGLRRRRFQEPEFVDAIRRDFTQQGAIEWVIQCEYVNLVDHVGVYSVLDAVLAALSGFAPAAPTAPEAFKIDPMYLQSDAFSGLDEAVYTYTSNWLLPITYRSDISGGQIPPVFDWQVLRLGLHRAKVDDLADEVLDQELDFDVSND